MSSVITFPRLNTLTAFAKQIIACTSAAEVRALISSAFTSHASTHAAEQSDALSPAAIGAAESVHTHAAASTTAAGFSPQATAPGAGLRSVLGIDNGETARTDKALFDATNPVANGTAAPGTAMTAARRDHVHATDTTRAASGANADITSLSGLTTPLSIAQGGTAGATAAAARTALGIGAIGLLGTVQRTVRFSFGDAAALSSGMYAVVRALPFGFTPTKWTLTASAADQKSAASAATVTVGLYVDDYAVGSLPTTSVGGTQPAVSAAIGAQSLTPGFTDTTWAKGQSVLAKIEAVPACTALWCDLEIEGTATE